MLTEGNESTASACAALAANPVSSSQSSSTQSPTTYEALPNPTSIRVLEILEADDGNICCNLRTIDLEDEPAYAALSYTWGNPVTVYEEPMPDLNQWKWPDEAEKFPFTYATPPLGPNGEALVSSDGAKMEYLDLNFHKVPYEKVAWKGGKPHIVIVNDQPVQVEENLFNYLTALRSMRKRFSENRDEGGHLYESLRLPIWIDAICINQRDVSERSAQVLLMGRIFKSAVTVFAWLGEGDNLTNLSWSSIAWILDYESERTDAGFAFKDSSDMPEPDEISLSSVPKMSILHWFALFSLFQRLWFRRAWIAQEAIFAKDMLVWCGDNLVNIHLLLAVFSFIEKNGLDHELCRLGRNLLTDQPLSGMGQHLAKLVTVSQTLDSYNPAPSDSQKTLEIDPWDTYSFMLGFHHVRGRLGISEAGPPILGRSKTLAADDPTIKNWNLEIPWSIKISDHILENGPLGFKFRKRTLRLLSVLSNFRNLDATDPRDKLFAFINLATDDLGLIPDYRASVQDIFRHATEEMIRKYDSLAVLSHVQDPSEKKVDKLPGWVPDFSVRLGRTPFDKGDEVVDFCASGHLNMPVHFCADRSLEIEGIRVDKIAAVTDINTDPVVNALKLTLRIPAKYPVVPFAWWVKKHGTNTRRELHPKSVSRVEALWRTLIADSLTEFDDGYSGLNSRVGLASGFLNWILADILDARSLLAEHADIDPEHWIGKLIHESFSTRLALWMALYDEEQTPDFSDAPDLQTVIRAFTAKVDAELGQDQLNQEFEAPRPIRVEYLPTASEVSFCFQKKVPELKGKEDMLSGRYKTDSLQRLTQLGRRQLRNFEKFMRNATEGRQLFCTDKGLLGLGPKSTSKDKNRTDEIWILRGARVPFILRAEGGNRYKIVGEAYVHGIMYGEEVDRFYDDDMDGEGPQKMYLV